MMRIALKHFLFTINAADSDVPMERALKRQSMSYYNARRTEIHGENSGTDCSKLD